MRSASAAFLALLLAGCAARPVVEVPVDVPGPAPAPETPPPPAEPIEAWRLVQPIVLETPPWDHELRDEVGRRAVVVPRLTRLSETPNSITDEEAWLRRHGLAFPGGAEPTRPMPFLYRDEARTRVIEQAGWTLAVYGSPTAGRSHASRALAARMSPRIQM